MRTDQTLKYDVFLSHNSREKPLARELKRRLSAKGLSVWLDIDELRPGIPWQRPLEQAIRTSKSVAVLVGSDGLGPWEDEEMQGALRLAVKSKARPVIPVLLPGARRRPRMPMFLSNRTWVKLDPGLKGDGLEKLLWAITGSKPHASSTNARNANAGAILAIGSGNLENLLVCEQRLTLGEKHEVTLENLWGGSAVNFTSRLLASGLPVIPILAVGKDPAGSKICHALYESAVSGRVAPRIRNLLLREECLMDGIATPMSTILVHGRERTIFRSRLQTPSGFNDRFKAKIKSILASISSKPTSVMLGHLPTEGRGTPKPGECTQFVLGSLPEGTLLYGVFGSTQLALSWKSWASYLNRVDVFQCNMEEAMRFFAVKSQNRSLRIILDLLRKRKLTAVLTMDRFGAVAIYKGGDFISIAWPMVRGDEIVDSTGAGDAFAAGMVSQLHQYGRAFSEVQFERALHEGSIWAAAACTSLGGCGKEPKKELDRFRHDHPDAATMAPERRLLATAQEVVNFIDLAYH